MKTFFEIEFYKAKFIIPSYSVFTILGLFFAMIVLYIRIEKIKPDFKRYLLLCGMMGAGVVIGSKMVFTITQLPVIIENFSVKFLIYKIIMSGFVFYGGLFGAIIGLKLYSEIMKTDFHILTDIIAPIFPLFHAFGRIGCFFAGCCYGKDIYWGIAMEFSPKVPRIPVQLIESGYLFFITGFLFLLEKKMHKGNLLFVYLFLYSIGRFILEFFRGDIIRGYWYGLSTSQWISVLILLFLFIKMVIVLKNKH